MRRLGLRHFLGRCREASALPEPTGTSAAGRAKRQHAQQGHLGAAARVRSKVQIAPTHNRDLVEKLHVCGRHASASSAIFLLVKIVIAIAGADNLEHGDTLQITREVIEQRE